MTEQGEILEMEEPISVRFHGGIINTLTKELPNDAVAFRELIKNAYDASADNVTIALDTKNRRLLVEDDGDGMDLSGMHNLFHLGQSHKQYGSRFESTRSKESRFVQGSKGIGFLSAMHFGSSVTWSSAKSDQYVYSVSCNREELKALNDLSKAVIQPVRTAKKRRGTRIVIDLDEYHFNSVCKSFSNIEWLSKVSNTFRKSSIKISFLVDGEKLKCEYLAGFEKRREKFHYFYVRFSSEDNLVEIFNESTLLESFAVSDSPLDSSLKISGEIIILKLSNSYGVKKVSNLFINNEGALTPLLYVNDNLFEEYSLFNPGINRRQKSGKSLPQMIGYIDVVCDSPQLDYNPDRTKFVQNELTDSIRDVLLQLNENIQTKASQHKKTVSVGFPIPEKLVTTACITLSRNCEYKIPSPQIDLRDLIIRAVDSEGNSINRSEIDIYIDGEKTSSHILESQTASAVKEVEYRYVDPHTKLIAASAQLVFKAEKQKKIRKPLLHCTIENPHGKYMKVCANLSEQLNKIYIAHRESYNEVYACSLRAVFELAAASVRNSRILPKSVREPSKIDETIVRVLEYIIKNKKTRELISKYSDIDFNTLGNFTVSEFAQAYEISNRGAHKSTTYLNTDQISVIAHEASIFSYLVNALLNAISKDKDAKKTKQH